MEEGAVSSWTHLLEEFSSLDTLPSAEAEPGVVEAVSTLCECGLSHLVRSWLCELLRTHLVDSVAVAFWNDVKSSSIIRHLKEPTPQRPLRALAAVNERLTALAQTLRHCFCPQLCSSQSMGDMLFLLVQQEVFFARKKALFRALYDNFRHSFAMFAAAAAEGEGGLDVNEEFHSLARCLASTRLLGHVEPVVTQLLHHEIDAYVANTCAGEWERPMVEEMQEWAASSIFRWLAALKGGGSQLQGRTQYYIYESFSRLRMRELFDIVSDFPDSEAALYDLQTALGHVDLKPKLIRHLNAAFSARLLIPGASTPDIIRVFVLMTKALSIVDPSSVIFNSVSEPIRDYLSRRDDTIRCIVASLTGHEGEAGTTVVPELQEELQTTGNAVDPLERAADSDDEWDDEHPWLPDPIFPVEIASASFPSARRTRDIISSLVNIYGSKDLFVQEYKRMLAERLLKITDYDTEQEVVTLELLKLRFGEASLHDCKVMLQDVEDSRFTNQNIHSRTPLATMALKDGAEGELDCTIVSSLFWPNFREDTLTVPSEVDNAMREYAQHFAELKKPRRLAWMPHLGVVTVELVFSEGEDGEIRKVFSVSPVHAAIIYHFGEQDTWGVPQLAEKLGVLADQLRKKITFWVAQGVLREQAEKGTYTMLDSPNRASALSVVGDDEEDEAAAQETEREWEMVGTFVSTMLENFGRLPLSRIHEMLSMTMPTYENTQHELGQHLQSLVGTDVLDYADGHYTLKSRGT